MRGGGSGEPSREHSTALVAAPTTTTTTTAATAATAATSTEAGESIAPSERELANQTMLLHIQGFKEHNRLLVQSYYQSGTRSLEGLIAVRYAEEHGAGAIRKVR